jgi:ribosomal protein L7Ae-like RNA K-turn-binding protein
MIMTNLLSVSLAVFIYSIVVLAGNTSPVDVICHVPVMCEDSSLPYCYVPSKEVDVVI